ncbi:MAG: hypothetical protein [Bacteriophage sp.]|nr:MAG: hypothetical protein [Bacteriophage sp.]UWI17889.1 MAG: hypothetical protein [Bacteriophage sp.]
MAWTEQDLREIEDELKKGSQGVGDVPEAESLDGITSLPAYQEVEGQDMPSIVRAPLTLLAAPALEAADKANAAATKAESNATAAQTAANSANEKAGLAAQAASDANAAKEGAETATQSANNAASNAEEKAAAANTAAQDAEKVANNPTYIGKDHYVYVYNKDTESFNKTDIYCKGEPGSSFRVAGEYDTLEALKSAIPDGSAVDGFMAVGTEAPYDYYAWVNGEWVSQGKIGGIDEAPTDGKAYGRKNGDWAEVSDKKYVDDSISSARSVGYMMQLTEIDASGLDENTWYPVTIAAGERMNIRVEVLVSLDSGTKPSWSTHERGFSTRKIWEFAPYAWGVNRDSKTTIYLSDFLHTDIDPVRGLGNLSHFDTCYVFVRGGGKYHFYASHEAKVILHTDTYAPGDQSVSPTTETPAEIVANIATKEYADNIGYGKVIDVDGNDSINNINAQGTEAENRINRLFGSINSFKNVVIDIVNSHAKYHFHLFNLTSNCIEMGSVFAYVSSSENNRHLLSFIFTYLDYCKHCKIDVTDVSKEVIIKDLVASDNLTTLTKKTAAEYEAIGSKDANTAYCVTD